MKNKPLVHGLGHSGKLKTVTPQSKPTRNDKLNRQKSLKDEADR